MYIANANDYTIQEVEDLHDALKLVSYDYTDVTIGDFIEVAKHYCLVDNDGYIRCDYSTFNRDIFGYSSVVDESNAWSLYNEFFAEGKRYDYLGFLDSHGQPCVGMFDIDGHVTEACAIMYAIELQLRDCDPVYDVDDYSERESRFYHDVFDEAIQAVDMSDDVKRRVFEAWVECDAVSDDTCFFDVSKIAQYLAQYDSEHSELVA